MRNFLNSVVNDYFMIKFIVFEGLDGAGLSTQAWKLRDYLQSKGKGVVLTKEPTNSLIGGLIRSSLRKEWKTSPLSLQMLFVADRAHHLANEIEPAIKKGKIVICDRYILSTLAFGSLDVNMNFLKHVNMNFRRPDITFIIDTQPRICLQRIKKSRNHTELFEEEQKLIQIRNNYLSLKNHFSGTFIVDGNKDVEDVFKDIKRICDKKIY